MPDKKILIVDDESEVIDLISSSLGELFEVVAANGSNSALEAAMSDEYSLAMFDIHQDDETAYDLCEKFKASRPDTPVVFLSSKEGEEDILHAYEVGGLDVITMPFQPRLLQEKICKLMQMNEQLGAVKESQAASQQVAHDAMSLASRYGMIVSFLDTNVETNEIVPLMENLRDTCAGLNLSTAIVCFDEQNKPIYSNANPIEEKFILALRGRGRIVDHHHRTLYTAGFVSILVKNMPIDNPTEYGMIKDIFAPLVTGASSRVKAIIMQDALNNARNQLIDASQIMDEALNKQGEQLTKMINDYLTDVQSTLMILEMTEDQEDYVLSQADEHMKSIVALVSDQTITKESIQGVVRNISALL